MINIEMLPLRGYDNFESLDMHRSIEEKKYISKILKDANGVAKKDNCYYCDEPTTSFCNSHTIPQFCLKNIASQGHVYWIGSIINFGSNKEKGIKEASTFRIICKNCDNTIFQTYEDPQKYDKKPTHLMLSQIAIKNYLRCLAKREFERALYENLLSNGKLNKPLCTEMKNLLEVTRLDLDAYTQDLDYAKNAARGQRDNFYELQYFTTLDYVVPIAFQGNICMIQDFKGNINNVFDLSTRGAASDIHICVFPLKEKSVVFMFSNNNDIRYRSFFRDFTKLSLKQKLKTINFIILAYSEDIFIYKGIGEEWLSNTNVQKVIRQRAHVRVNASITNIQSINSKSFIKGISNEYDLNNRHSIPNLLDSSHRVL